MTREQAKIWLSIPREKLAVIASHLDKHFDFLCAYANGAEIEFREPKDDKWFPNVFPYFRSDLDYRVKPNDAAKPTETWNPENEDTYFCIDDDGYVFSYEWTGGPLDIKRLDLGNCFRTYVEAEAARERVRAALKGETISKTEKVESLDGHELSDAEKGVIRILRRCKARSMWGCDFVYPEDHSALTVCESGVLLEFESDTKACEFGDLADDVILEAKERREKGEPSW